MVVVMTHASTQLAVTIVAGTVVMLIKPLKVCISTF